jgi:hypothetical protein
MPPMPMPRAIWPNAFAASGVPKPPVVSTTIDKKRTCWDSPRRQLRCPNVGLCGLHRLQQPWFPPCPKTVQLLRYRDGKIECNLTTKERRKYVSAGLRWELLSTSDRFGATRTKPVFFPAVGRFCERIIPEGTLPTSQIHRRMMPIGVQDGVAFCKPGILTGFSHTIPHTYLGDEDGRLHFGAAAGSRNEKIFGTRISFWRKNYLFWTADAQPNCRTHLASSTKLLSCFWDCAKATAAPKSWFGVFLQR